MRSSLKLLIFYTICMSLLAGFIPQLHTWLALSKAAIQNLFLWQLVSYVFVERDPISFSFFLNLIFNMYILWVFGSQLIHRSHERLFLALYFGAVVLGGASALIFPNFILAGSTNGVYAILLAWMLLNQKARVLLFFAIPFKAEWLILALIGMILLIDLSQGSWAAAISLTISCVYSYLFTLVVWRVSGPFSFLRKFEKIVLRFLERRKNHEPFIHSKIYDIKSGEPVLDDEQFMDAMLDRIARHGKEALTGAEKKRMDEISKKRK